MHVDLVLVDREWLVSAADAEAGPTPAANELMLQAGWDDFAEVASWTPVVRRGRAVTAILAWPWDPIVDAVTAPFKAAAGWAWDTVIGGITDWLAKGFVQLVSFVWEVMDRSSSPHLTSDWFSNSAGAPYLTAVAIASGLLAIFLFCALIQGALAGRPMELVKRMVFDTPAAVAGILFTVAFTQVAIDVVDAMSDGIWQLTHLRRSRRRRPATHSVPKLSPVVLGAAAVADRDARDADALDRAVRPRGADLPRRRTRADGLGDQCVAGDRNRPPRV